MALILPCTFCTSLQKKNFPINRRYITNFRRGATTATCEFRIPVEVSTPSDRGSLVVPSHKVTVHDRQRGVVHEFEDQYILHSAESQNISLPFACRHGCCTSCAVRVKSGELRQPQALGISAELKSQRISSLDLIQCQKTYLTGYALLCVGFPTSDLEVETQDEDEVYWLQFGRYFARGPIERDDYALELAMGDE
ncbi:2Fe-2S ferredoxin-like superfamily protein [Arabidopsis thaliana]|uniref:2Fe-2S ferredoxin-like superfamily protein n=1 Tax=Arabidopsis thaliana TaxID=3702 RepID=F4IE99_ARATH|nr:2Fe-2S ferredoxin-like superfamily protein [Arabidopsis thaliana]AEE31502.1 2Fe-2S ferredoxin-like superfamily protein [Arabidopsis thaliana]|eukprot:NP_001154389.1 2Fe-2S ferredoxin-like superfamily protein [Arabidopsis thaliana]